MKPSLATDINLRTSTSCPNRTSSRRPTTCLSSPSPDYPRSSTHHWLGICPMTSRRCSRTRDPRCVLVPDRLSSLRASPARAHSCPLALQVRKRAVLCMYRVFEKYPEALEDNFSRLSERLDDDDQGEPPSIILTETLLELVRRGAYRLTQISSSLVSRCRVGDDQRSDRARPEECAQLSSFGASIV